MTNLRIKVDLTKRLEEKALSLAMLTLHERNASKRRQLAYDILAIYEARGKHENS